MRRDATRGERIPEQVLDAVRGTEFDKGVVLDRLARADDAAAELVEMHNYLATHGRHLIRG